MKSSNSLWKERLAGTLPAGLEGEIDTFEMEIERRSQDQIDEIIFAETRLRRGVYGQRYDNGERYDGTEQRPLAYDGSKPTKGHNTVWDAPSMMRIKVPFGGVRPEQLEVMADLAEEYSDAIAHITTRQDFQLHYVHVEDSPSIMRRLAAVDITTREACGNSVRNVTGCPYSGICTDQAFDVTPYARALTQFLLGHPDVQNFGRKFKPSFSGCGQHSCGLAALHDLAYVAKVRTVDGKEQRGFEVYVGGGLGTVPHQAKLLDEFMPVEEMLPIAQAIARVFTKHGEKKNRARARIKFLVSDWGIEKFKEEVVAERAKLKDDVRWRDYLRGAEDEVETPLREAGRLPEAGDNLPLARWMKTNLREQRQEGYVTATVTLPLGDISSDQLRELSDIVRKYTNGTIRTTVEQNFVVRWVSKSDVAEFFAELDAAGLGQAGAGHILDIVACPGTDTCKLGVSSSRGLAAELRKRLATKSFELDQAIQDLHIKISGCFNSCGQHHVGDIGFYGMARTMKGFKVPHFQVVLGGEWENNAGSYGLPIIPIPARRVPDAVDMLTEGFVREREEDESFAKWIARMGKKDIRARLELFKLDPPEPEDDPAFFRDWGDPRSYTTGDIGRGECAGEMVTQFQFESTDAERMIFAAQVFLEEGQHQEAGKEAYLAMVKAAKALVLIQYDDVSNDPDEIVEEFEERYFDTKLIYDPYAGPKFANHLFDAHKNAAKAFTAESARHTMEEAALFLEAVHSCYNRLGSDTLAEA